jgi:hypothetical protein
MSPTTPTTCTHDRGRGTTVRLRCRHDEWQASQKRRQQMLMRFFGLASVIGIIAIAGAAGAISLRGNSSTGAAQTSAGNVSLLQEGRSTKSAGPRPRAPRALAPTPARIVAEPEPMTPATVPAPAAPIAPSPAKGASLLGQGRTTLTDSIYAVRTGDSVVVNFDTHGNRTRRADKFEQMLRTTLPLVYGRRIASSLDSVPTGALLPSRDVVGELTSQGMRLTLDNGLRISLWPQTRPSADGLLVVAYRVVVER